MSRDNLSIAGRLKKAKRPELRLHIATEWATDWQEDQQDILRQLDRAIQSHDWNAVVMARGQLRAVTDKRFAAIVNVLRTLAHDTPHDN